MLLSELIEYLQEAYDRLDTDVYVYTSDLKSILNIRFKVIDRNEYVHEEAVILDVK